jgi:5'-nucleotidase
MSGHLTRYLHNLRKEHWTETIQASLLRGEHRSQRLFLAAALAIAEHEDMGFLDSYERQRARMMARRQPGSLTAGINLQTGVLAASQKVATIDADKEEARVDAAEVDAKKNLPVVHPVVDGRLKDVARG